MLESVDMIQKIWTQDPPYDLQGKYYSIKIDQNIHAHLGTGFMPKPFQKPMPPIAMSVMSPHSGTAKRAAMRGWSMMSANFVSSYILGTHWQKYLEGCDAIGVKADPTKWRVARNILVARTDEEAREFVADARCSQRFFFDYLWQALRLANYTVILKADPNMPDENVTLDMMLDDMVISGSPATVTEKLVALREKIGPFGSLMLGATDWEGVNRDREENSMRLLATEVMPRLNKLGSVKAA